MKKLFLIIWLLVSTILTVAQEHSDDLNPLVGVPIVVEKKSADITFRATVSGKPVKVERNDASDSSPLRIVVIDARPTAATEQFADKIPAELRTIDLRALQAQGGLIRIGRPATKSSQTATDWKLFTSPDLESARRTAESFFAAGAKDERQTLLVIKNSSLPDKEFDSIRFDSAVDAAGRLVTILPDGSATADDHFDEKKLKRQIKNWRDNLSLFYVLRIKTNQTVLAVGGRIDAEAVFEGQVIGRASKQISVAPPSSNEVESAFADYPRIKKFEALEKYPGLSDADLEFFRSRYAPPIEGVVIASDPIGNERLQRLSDSVFRLHDVQRQCIAVLLESRVPTVFTWKLTFVSLTTKDLEILSDEEITALIAHEIGHLYFADALLKARASGDDRLARIAELKCDLIALETLRRLKISETNLTSAIEKLIHERSAMNLKTAEAGSPALEDRRRIVSRYAENRRK